MYISPGNLTIRRRVRIRKRVSELRYGIQIRTRLRIVTFPELT
jgi:hypothetical protein